MGGRSRNILLVGLVLLGLVGLFPPRRATDMMRPHRVASRAFLFSGSLYEYQDERGEGFSAEVDVGRLLAEVLLVASLTGIGLAAASRPGAGPTSKETPRPAA